MKQPMRDIVVVIPGITGSVLQHDGRDVWAVSKGSIWNLLTSLGRSFDRLVLAEDDPQAPTLPDGITATRLMDDVHLIPGLWKIDGYSGLLRMLRDGFEFLEPDPRRNLVGNLHPFPYDWRRDIASASLRLAHLVEEVLPRWRERIGFPDARVIVIAHSLGGLVAEHWFQLRGGREQCRAIFTIGTPFRGSPAAVTSLVNGVGRFGVNLSELIRSFTSVHQLLPIYECVQVEDAWVRVAETTLPGVNSRMATEALAMHRSLEAAAAGDSWRGLRPYLGARQSTTQSLRFEGARVVASAEPPGGIDPALAGGDGTVPGVSAVPIHLSDASSETFLVERHAVLQSNGQLLDDLRERLTRLQSTGLPAIRGDLPSGPTMRLAICLDAPDLVLAHEPFSLSAHVSDAELDLVVTGTDDAGAPAFTLEPGNTQAPGVPPGVYRIRAAARSFSPDSPTPVSDVVIVVDPEAGQV